MTVGLGRQPTDPTAVEHIADVMESLMAGAEAYPEMLRQYTQPGMQALTGALAAPQAALGMGLQDVYANPALQAQADVIQQRLNRNLMEGILPTIRGGAATRGTLGGTGQQISEAVAGRGTQEALGSALADLYGGAWQAGLGAETARYGAGLGAAGQAMGMLPRMAQLGLSEFTEPARLQLQAGEVGMAPYQRAATGMGALMTPATAFGPRTSKSEVQSQPSTFSNVGNILGAVGGLGGALAGPIGGLATNLLGGPSEAMLGGYGTTGAGPWGMAGEQWGYGGLYG